MASRTVLPQTSLPLPGATAPQSLAASPAGALAAPRHGLFEDAQALFTGSLFVGLTMMMFAQAGLLTGSTAGLAFVLHYATGIGFGKLFFVLNLPFYWLALRKLGLGFTVKTFAGVALLAVLTEVQPKFDHVLLDTGAGISDVVLYTVSLAGEVLVVATPEPTSLTDAYATIKVLANTQGRRRMHLLVNQVRRPGEGRSVRAQLQQVVDRYVNPALDIPVRLELVGEIPADPAVREAVQRRQLLLESMPGTAAAIALANAAAKMPG